MVAFLTPFAKKISKRGTAHNNSRSPPWAAQYNTSLEGKEKKKKSLCFPAIITGAF